MSAEATGWVFRHSTATGVTFTVHLAIADSVNDQNDDEFWMRLDRLATKARCTRGTAGKAISWLVEHGYLVLLSDREGGRSKSARYRFLHPSEELRAQRAVSDGDTARSEHGSPAKLRAGRARKEPKGTSTQEQPPAPAAQSDPVVRMARTLVTEWWDRRKAAGAAPAQSFIGCVKIVETALRNGVVVGDVARALDSCATVTGASLEFSLSKLRGRVGRQAPPISEAAAAFMVSDYERNRPPPETGSALPLPRGETA